METNNTALTGTPEAGDKTMQKKHPSFDLSSWNKPHLYPLYAYLITTLTFLLALAFLKILGYGNMTILRSDMYGQYIPFIKMFQRAITEGESFWYSFSLYLGSGTILNHAYYCFSPFNLLYLIEGVSFSAITIVVITLKISLSSATFQIFVQKAMKQHHFSTVLLSVCYGLCGYAVTMHYQLMWLEAIYMLPIIFWLIIRLIDEKKGLALSLSFAYLFITNFYTAYMVGIASAIFYVCYLVYRKFAPNKTAVSDCFFHAFRFAGYILLAVGLSAIVLVPAAMFLIANLAQDNAPFLDLLNTLPDVVNSMFIGQMQTLDTQVPMLYCGIPVLLILPFYYSNKEISAKEKICISIPMLFLLLCCFSLPLYKFMHAFDYPNMYGFRFIFILVFMLVVIACRQLPYMKNIPAKHLCIYGAALIVLYSILIPIQAVYYPPAYYTNTQNGMLINLLFVALWICVYWLYYHKNVRHNLLIVFSLFILISELTVNAYICIDNEEHGNIAETTANSWHQTAENAINELQQTDNSFYRVNLNNSLNYNSASFLGYNGLTTFSSSDDYHLRNVLSHLGVSTSNRFISEVGFTPVTDMLFNVKYAVSINALITENNEVLYDSYSISQNEYTLPLGYMVSAQIVNYEAADNPFYNQMQLLTLMTETQYDNVYTAVSENELFIGTENMGLEYAESAVNFYHLSDRGFNSLISFSVPTLEDKEFYACFTQLTPGIFSDSPRIVATPQGMTDEILLSSGCIVKGTTAEIDGNKYDSVVLNFYPDRSWDYFCNYMYFYYYDTEILASIYNDLSPGAWNITYERDDYITGTVTATPERPILFTSIPYDTGWTAYVDGIETPIYSTLDEAFISIILEPGIHEVTMVYTPQGKDLGILISGASLIILLGIILIKRNKKNKKQRTQE
ncbi:MAG: YfhO family protein [Lachnospiraceae bacterium]|nr:YfhO family protein [Lachnospiraceae bacterium]